MKSSPFTSLTFNDKRISARANLTLSKMIATGNSVINRIFGNFGILFLVPYTKDFGKITQF